MTPYDIEDAPVIAEKKVATIATFDANLMYLFWSVRVHGMTNVV